MPRAIKIRRTPSPVQLSPLTLRIIKAGDLMWKRYGGDIQAFLRAERAKKEQNQSQNLGTLNL